MKGKGMLSLVAVALVAAMTTAQTAEAQRSFGLGVSGGLTLPTGDFGEVFNSGYHIGGHLNLAPASLPVELLFDVTYHSFEGDDDLVVTPFDFSFLSIAANAAYVLPGVSVRPYLMGGVGVYLGKADVEGAERESDVGLSLGGGLRFPLSGLSSFLQARVNFVDDVTMIPISFGIVF
jgi:opacity protein-like surface antigen